MNDHDIIAKSWRGKHLSVNILFSSAGIAQQIAVANDSGWILIDAGDGTLRDLRENNFDRRHLAGIVFTHGHFDHMGGLHTLLGFLRMIGRENDLPILIPAGCREVIGTVENFNQVYSGSIPFKIDLTEAKSGRVYEIAGMSIAPFDVHHCGSIEGGAALDRIPAFGYRITYKGQSIAISGDTGDCPGLREMVNGADLAIIEATFAKSSEATEEELKKVHLSEDLAVEIGSGAREYILVHRGRR